MHGSTLYALRHVLLGGKELQRLLLLDRVSCVA
jgi:hypothetical protein